MSTRSAIGIWDQTPSDEKFQAVYCHSDGYPSGAGKWLFKGVVEKANGNIGRVAETLLANRTGWSSIWGMELRLPPKWTEYGNARGSDTVTMHVREIVYTRWLAMIQQANGGKVIVSENEMDEAVNNGFRVRDANRLVICIHDNENYQLLREDVIIKNDHPHWKLAFYWAEEGLQSYTERGEFVNGHEMIYTTFSDLDDAWTEWAYIFDIQHKEMWIYNIGYESKPTNSLLPYAIIDLTGDEPDWDKVESGELKPDASFVNYRMNANASEKSD